MKRLVHFRTTAVQSPFFLLVLPVLIAALFSSCRSDLVDLPYSHEGVPYSLKKDPPVKSGEEGSFLFPRNSLTGRDKKAQSTPVYRLPKELSGSAIGELSFSWISGGGSYFLELFDGDDLANRYPLPGAPEGWEQALSFHLPNDLGRVSSFRIASEDEQPDSRFRLQSIASEAERSGELDQPGNRDRSKAFLQERFTLSFSGEDLLSPRFSAHLSSEHDLPLEPDRLLRGHTEPGFFLAELDLAASSSPLRKELLSLTYLCSQGLDAPVEGQLRLYREDSSHHISWSLQFRPGEHTISLGLDHSVDGLFRLEAEWQAEWQGEDLASVEIIELSLLEYPLWLDGRWSPLPADLGEAMDRPRDSWRRSDFEFYSWNLFPKLLVFDYQDYALQAAMLRRLAFFVEKKGWAGQVLPWETIANRHGWNAHDYRSGDLARFFTEAVSQGITLNPEEETLKEILLANGIIRSAGENRWEGVDGGILSLSQETSDRLRYLFMVHEGYHGLFFSSSSFREGVFTIWNNLSSPEQRFWQRFLDWKWYNVEDEYLLVNEFMAYLMQQTPDKVNSYYFDYIIPSMISSRPEWTAELEGFIKSYPDHYIQSALAIEQLAWETAGLKAGNLFDTRRNLP